MNTLNKKLTQNIHRTKKFSQNIENIDRTQKTNKLWQNTKPILFVLLALISISCIYITLTNSQAGEQNEDIKNKKNNTNTNDTNIKQQETNGNSNLSNSNSSENKHQTTQNEAKNEMQSQDDSLNESHRKSLFFSNKNLKSKKGNDYLILRGMIHHQNSQTIWINDKKITIKEENKRFIHKIGKTKFYIEKIDADGVTVCIINDDNSTREVFLKTHQKVYLN